MRRKSGIAQNFEGAPVRAPGQKPLESSVRSRLSRHGRPVFREGHAIWESLFSIPSLRTTESNGLQQTAVQL
jgi:hypothetical protein